MKQLKNYDRLYAMYCRSRNGLLIPFLVCLVLFVLSFGTIFLDFPFPVTIIMMLMIFPAIALGVVLLVGRGAASKSLAQFSAQELAEINREIPMRKTQEGFVVTRLAVIGGKGRLILCPVRNILWIYRDVTTFKMYDVIPIYKTTVLKIACKDKKRYTFKIKNKSNVEAFLRSELSEYRRDIIFGYESNLETLFQKDINRLIALSEEYGSRQERNAPQSERVAGKENLNTACLDSMPEVKNKYKVNLEQGEKVIFTAKLICFATEAGAMLGAESKFTMTNRRIIADNGKGIWTTDIAEDITGWRKEEKGKGLMKEVYVLITLNKELTYGIGVQKLTGYRFCFNKKDMAVFEELMRKLLIN